MSATQAALRDQYDAECRVRKQRLADQLLASELKHLLNRWGDWVEKHRNDTGLPTQCATLNIPGGEASHRILCADMAPKVWPLSRAIAMLEAEHSHALTIWYGYQRSDDGRWLDGQEKAREMGITYNALCQRVHKARKELLILKSIWAI